MGTEPVTGAGLLSTQRLDATPSSDADDLTGAELPGRFRLDRLLASGAFGTVYRARQLAVDRDVAVKVLHADIDPDSEDGRLFIHEIQAVGRIDHVNVVRIYQADVAPSGRLFFAMELLHGDDLQQVIDRDGPLPRTRALALIAQLLAGLGAAHDLGLVHADVKPGNLVVVGERLVLVDFGLARLRPPNQAAESMGGTPAYMAPEQLRDGRVDARSDLFAVGLVVVALLTGWQRVDLGELVPPLDTLIVDPELRAVLARALALDPAQRYQSAAELARALTGGDVAIAAPARSPFRHLAPFTEADRDHLHGRDRDVAALVEQLAIRRVLVYTAPSGTGKTSLLRAGLVPRLTALGLRALYVTASADGAAATARRRRSSWPWPRTTSPSSRRCSSDCSTISRPPAPPSAPSWAGARSARCTHRTSSSRARCSTTSSTPARRRSRWRTTSGSAASTPSSASTSSGCSTPSSTPTPRGSRASCSSAWSRRPTPARRAPRPSCSSWPAPTSPGPARCSTR